MHADSERGLRVQLATALKERDEARALAEKWALREAACVHRGIRADADALSEVQGLQAALAAANEELAKYRARPYATLAADLRAAEADLRSANARAEKEHETARGWSQKAAEFQDALAVRNEPPNESDLVSRIGTVQEALAAARRECDAFRKLLWLHHGCSPAFLYGDDGEMQCGDAGCLLDFKRQSAEEIEARWIAANHAALAAPADGEEKSNG